MNFKLNKRLINQYYRLPYWVAKAIEPNGIMENIRIFHFKMAADTKELARLQSGFLVQEIFDRFNQKINNTLQPNRSLWLYSAHDLTILCMLNSLGLFDATTFTIQQNNFYFFIS